MVQWKRKASTYVFGLRNMEVREWTTLVGFAGAVLIYEVLVTLVAYLSQWLVQLW